MDGVLIDAKEWHFEALNRALNIFGFEISINDHLKIYDGLPTKKKLEILSNHTQLPKQLHDLINDLKQQFTIDIAISKCVPNFSHQYALSKLKDNGYKLAVCSNSIKNSVNFMLTKSAIIKYFDFYLSSDDVKKSKPDPEIYLKAFKKFNLSPQECLILEDNINGIRAAKNAGAHVMQINNVSEVNYENIQKKIRKIEN